MAIRGPIPVHFDQVFPHGAYVTSEVEPIYSFTDGRRGEQETDDHGTLMWQVTVLDADPEAKGAAKSVKVKIAAKHQPVPPNTIAGTPFAPVEFTGMAVTPYVVEVMKGRSKVAYSLRASEMKPGKMPAIPKAQPNAA